MERNKKRSLEYQQERSEPGRRQKELQEVPERQILREQKKVDKMDSDSIIVRYCTGMLKNERLILNRDRVVGNDKEETEKLKFREFESD